MIGNKAKNFFLFDIFFVLSIFLFDRFSKIYVIYLDKKSIKSEIFSSNFLNIHLIWNEGIAFGLLSSDDKIIYNILTVIITFVILILYFMIKKSYGFQKYCLLMIMGGALGNVYDRIFYFSVPDFIDFHIGDFHWFIFNVSDIFITIGVIGMISTELTAKKTKNVN